MRQLLYEQCDLGIHCFSQIIIHVSKLIIILMFSNILLRYNNSTGTCKSPNY